MAERLRETLKMLSIQSRLQQWRKQHTLDRSTFRNFLYGKKECKVMDDVFDIIMANLNIFKHENIQGWTKEEQRKSVAIMMKMFHRVRPADFQEVRKGYFFSMTLTTHAIYFFDPGFSVKCDLTFFLYAKSLFCLSSDNKLQKQFVDRAINSKQVGCFGLTELGHGSNVKGIKTEAHYDRKTKEFILNTPCEEGMKFWIGASSEVATMAVIWAQLCVQGKSYGPHAFIVQLRDSQTHLPLPGIIIGDCGPKNGLNSIDNGYILFENCRISKDHALNRFSGVDSDGNFTTNISNPEKLFGLHMSPLSGGRAYLSMNAIAISINALAIAIRYACQKIDSTQSSLLIDCPEVRMKLIPALAQAYVFYFGGVNLARKYDQNLKQLTDSESKIMEELHAFSGACKAKSTWFTLKTVTDCRQACGSDGLSTLSGFNRLYHSHDVNTTWEGDNNVLLQQTTKYIIKQVGQIRKGKKASDFLKFLSKKIEKKQKITKEQIQNVQFLEHIFQQRVQQSISDYERYAWKLTQLKYTPDQIWNGCQAHFGSQLALLFGDLYYLRVMVQRFQEMPVNLRSISENCLKLWAYQTLLSQKFADLEARKLLQLSIFELISWLTPRSVSLIDVMAPPDPIIGSIYSDSNGTGLSNFVSKLFSTHGNLKKSSWTEQFQKIRDSQL